MRLRNKCIMDVGLTLIGLVVLETVVSHRVLLSGFARVERESMERNVKRAADAFGDAIDNLGVRTTDWASWDDTYRFIIDHNIPYLESNLHDETFDVLGINMILFFDSTAQLVYSRGYDLDKKQGYSLTTYDMAPVAADTLLVPRSDKQHGVAGLKLFEQGPMYVVSRPILKSDGKGPCAGTLVFGRFVDKKEIERVAAVTHIAIEIFPCGQPDPDSSLASIRRATEGNAVPFVRPLGKDRIAGYATLDDINGDAALLLKVESGRAVYRQGVVTLVYLTAFILLAGVVFGLAIFMLLRRRVLVPVSMLCSTADAIARNADNSVRMKLVGNDELAMLGSSINGMLSSLERVKREVALQNSRLHMIMDTVPAGLLTIDESFTVSSDYSACVERIFGRSDIAGKNFFDLLDPGDSRADMRSELAEYLSLLRIRPLPESEMAALNPLEELTLRRNDGETVSIRLNFFNIHSDGNNIRHQLAILTDITDEKRLSERVERIERENFRLRAFAEDPDLFMEFLAVSLRTIWRFLEVFAAMHPPDSGWMAAIEELFREVHTIKGEADAFGLDDIVAAAARLETATDRMRRDAGVPVADDLAPLRSGLADLSGAIGAVHEEMLRVLGESSAGGTELHIKLPLEKIASIRAAFASFVENLTECSAHRAGLMEKVDRVIMDLREIPARRGFAKTLRMVPGLINRCEKMVNFRFVGADVPIDCAAARELDCALMHLMRNAVDHGFETPEKRLEAGKDPTGTLTLSVERRSETVLIQVTDDGKGLDTASLLEKGLNMGAVEREKAGTLDDRKLFDLVFVPGLTTAQTITDFSGRGVGLDAARSIVTDRLNGSCRIDSAAGRGVTVTITIPAPECALRKGLS